MTGDNPLPGMKGISAHRDCIQSESALSTLLSVGERVIQKYASMGTSIIQFQEQMHQYNEMHYSLERELRETEFNASDLKSLVTALANLEFGDSDPMGSESMCKGMYTGALLHILTDRARRNGKTADVYIDGYGEKFDYLFYMAREADNVIINDLAGEHVCNYMGAHGGNVGFMLVMNHSGNNVCSQVGSDGGRFGTLIVTNSNGGHAGYCSADPGIGGLLLIANHKGRGSAQAAGGEKYSHIHSVMIVENDGDDAGVGVGASGGNVDLLFLKSCYGHSPAGRAGWANQGKPKGHIGHILLESAGIGSSIINFGVEVGQSSRDCGRDSGSSVKDDKRLTHKEQMQERDRLIELHRLDEIVELVYEMRGTDASKTIAAAKKIKAIQEAVRGEKSE